MRLSKSDRIFLPFLAIENHVIRVSFFFPAHHFYGIQSPIQHPADRNSSLQMLEFCIALFMEKTKLIVRKTDRRTVMTKGMIQDALLELLQNTPYEKITVTALCKQSEITRATFYLHYK